MQLPSQNLICKELDGIPTEILLQTFADRVLVLVTQIGKVGNLIQVTIPSTTVLATARPFDTNEQHLPPIPAAIELTPLLGSARSEHLQTVHSLYAAQMATIIWNADFEGQLEVPCRCSVIVGIALRNSDGSDEKRERNLFLQVMAMLRELLMQNSDR